MAVCMQAMIQSRHSFQPNAATANGGDSDADADANSAVTSYVGISWALSRGPNEDLTRWPSHIPMRAVKGLQAAEAQHRNHGGRRIMS